MSFTKFKRIMAQTLIVALLLPSFNVQAVTNTVPSQEKTVESTIVESTENTEKVEETQEKKLNTEDKASVDKEVKVEEKTEEANKTEVKQETQKEAKTSISDKALPAKGTKYKKKKAVNTQVRTFSMATIDEPEEYKLKRAAVEKLEVLIPLTDKNYELTIANTDGSYEFVNAYNSLDEAKTAANNLVRTNSITTNQVPEVINYSGNTVYTTNQMGRLIIYTNNSPSYSGNVNLYTDSSLTKAFTYVNVGSVEDVPVLEMTDKAAKIMVSGFVGWIPNDVKSGTYNIKPVSTSKATNPSYYTVKNGELVHYISFDLEAKADTSGFPITLGKAPSYLKEGKRYLSYDGKYFYEYTASNLATISDKMISDYKKEVRTNSVNNNNPFYLYYLYLPFRSKTVYTASDLNKYITGRVINYVDEYGRKPYQNSKLNNLGQAFKDAESKYGVNALLALGIAINESGYGNSNIAQTKNNLFGIKAYDSDTNQAETFASPADSVVEFSKNYISAGYADLQDWRYYGGFLGNKNRGVNVKYASDPFWGEKAAKYAYEIDKYLSGGYSNLRDTNSKQIGIATADNSVIKKDGSLLYSVLTTLGTYAMYTEIPFVINDLQKVTISGKQYYEITPEISNSLYNKSTVTGYNATSKDVNDFDGNYNWNQKGYILASNINLINIFAPQVEKRYGETRYETAVELSKSSFSKSETVIVAYGYGFADGLAATPIASYYNAPILLVEKNSVPEAVKNEIKRLGAKNIIIVGGTDVVTSNVEKQLKNLGISKVTRLGGQDRYETALKIVKYIDSNLYDVENIIVSYGYGEADALSAAPVSGRDRMPIILVDKNSVPSSVNNWLKEENINNAYIIGGIEVVSNNVLNQLNKITKQDISKNRLGGETRYETNAMVINKFYGSVVNRTYITKGEPLADALTSGPVAAINGSPIVLSDTTLKDAQRSVLKGMTTNKIIQVGGTVSQEAVQNLKELLSRTK
ncbi:cell wall-binding repeat-containing protein [Clostridium isatidis]|uniref:cell wall-binding repeat-containing protein n=1 Tax=Clostridium isatidis TaxID=182773 RepID=UPI003AAC9D6D